MAVSSVKDYSARGGSRTRSRPSRPTLPAPSPDYAKRYADLSAEFAAAYDPFQKSPTPKKWADQDRSGAKIDPLDPAVLREKKEIAGYLLNIRKVLFIFERVYYRVDEIVRRHSRHAQRETADQAWLDRRRTS